jgi:hypothetical protein
MSTTSIEKDLIDLRNESGKVIGFASKMDVLTALKANGLVSLEVTDAEAIKKIRGDSSRSVSAGYEILDAPNP